MSRPVLVTVPEDVAVPGPLTLQGYGFSPEVSLATLGGRPLDLLTVTARELVFAVDPATPPGPQELRLVLDGVDLPSRFVTVR